MTVLYCKVGECPKIIEIKDKLEEYQKLVGGYIECVSIGSNIVLICNEDGRLTNSPNRNVSVYGMIYGDFLICKTDGDNFADIDSQSVTYVMELIK